MDDRGSARLEAKLGALSGPDPDAANAERYRKWIGWTAPRNDVRSPQPAKVTTWFPGKPHPHHFSGDTTSDDVGFSLGPNGPGTARHRSAAAACSPWCMRASRPAATTRSSPRSDTR